MITLNSRSLQAPILLAVLAGSIFFLNLGGARLWDDDEPKNAGCGREMYEAGNWLVPTFNHELRPHKPVMLYWAMIASYHLVGDSEFAARLPSALASIGTVLLVFFIGRKLFDETTGLLAGVLLASGLMFTVLSRAATPDAILILFTTGALYFFVTGLSKLRGGTFSGRLVAGPIALLDEARLPTREAIGMYGCIALAVLTKGPIGILLPLTSLAVYAAILCQSSAMPSISECEAPTWKTWLKHQFAPSRVVTGMLGFRLPLGILIVLLVAGPWYVAVTLATGGDWLLQFLGTHNVHRFLHPMERHSGPFFYYVIAVLAGFFPGSCFLPVAVFQAIREHRNRSTLAHSFGLLLAWAGTYLVFFSLAATKLPNYIVPCYPAIALLTGAWLVSSLRRAAASDFFWMKMGMASYALVGLILTCALAYVAHNYWEGKYFVAFAGIVPLASGIACFILLRHERSYPALITFAASGIAFVILGTSVTAPAVSPYQTSANIGAQLARLEEGCEQGEMAFATYHYTRPNVVYYTGKHVRRLAAEAEVLKFLKSESHAVVVPRSLYNRFQEQLPDSIGILDSHQRFMVPEEQILILGHRKQKTRTQLARTNNNSVRK